MSEGHSSDFARQLELAWAAGFFDGEGCTHLSKSERKGIKHSYVRITIAQVNRTNLERWQKAVGAGTIGNAHVRGGNSQPFYVLTVAAGRVKFALDAMWPYLGEEKKRQAEEMLRTGEVGRGLVRDREACIRGHPLVPGNIYRRSDGRLRCKICCGEAERRYVLKKRNQRREHLRADDIDDDRPQSESLG